MSAALNFHKDLKVIPFFDGNGRYLYHDLEIKNNDFVIIEGKEAIAQRVMIRLRTRKGENPYAPEVGLDFVGEIFEPSEDSEIPKTAIIACVKSTPGVTAVKNFELTFDATTRAMKVTFDLETIFGTIPITDLIT